uniref:ATP synthase F0 subunit 8 n=1 Tax=Pelagomacellicephala iliffei TaxID=1960706 RepID=A0A8E7IUE8_9ANNE|nr:ATP synthase F0 subunit 8 [Pelagomacellicephala iliffei]
MPHLSPLNWLLTPFILWSLLLMFSSTLWWSQTLHFPSHPLPLSPPPFLTW